MIMNKKILPAVILLSCGRCLSAQEPAATLTDWSSYRLMDAVQTLRRTHNAAALSVDTFATRGFAQFGFVHSADGFHRVQEGTGGNALHFQTERYQSIGQKLVAYGRFDFDYGHVRNRAWCDVRNAYDGNPYFAGSSVAGSYDNMDFSLTAALGTVEFSGWRFGGQLDYGVGDLSRLRDPRSRSEMLDYRIAPSVSYSVGRQTIGIDAHYRRRKEKMPTLTTVQSDPNLVYYLMSGMENVSGTVGGYSSFSREWVNHEFGGGVTYDYRRTGFSTTDAVSLSRGAEDAFGQYKYEPGRFFDYTYAAQSLNRWSIGRKLHSLDVEVVARQAYADEYRQSLVIEKDAATGYNTYSYTRLLTYRKRYQVETLDATLRYQLHFLGDVGERGFVGVSANVTSSANKHVLPESKLHHARLDVAADGGASWIGGRLWVEADAGYSPSLRASLSLADATTPYATGVLLPDLDCYAADYWHCGIRCTWHFTLSIKGLRSMWYVGGSYRHLDASTSATNDAFGLTVGLFN